MKRLDLDTADGDLNRGVAAGVGAEGGVDEAEAGERLVAERLEVDGGDEAVVDGGQREGEAVDGDLDAAGGGVDADGALEGAVGGEDDGVGQTVAVGIACCRRPPAAGRR